MAGFFNIDSTIVDNAAAIEAEESKAFELTSQMATVIIKSAHVRESGSSAAVGMEVEFIAEGWKFPQRETFWFQGADGKTTRTAKRRDGTTYPDETFGMKQCRALAAVCGVKFETLETSDGIIKDFDGNNQNVKVFTDLLGKTFVAGLQVVEEDKYSEPTESRQVFDLIWVGTSTEDDNGWILPWGRNESYAKFNSKIAAEPKRDERNLSKGGSDPVAAVTGAAPVKMPF